MKTSDFCLRAARDYLTRLNWQAAEMEELLIFVSQSATYILPATAPRLPEPH
jgi:3-oxoacyl-[acyl-carrier-protein] synthase III